MTAVAEVASRDDLQAAALRKGVESRAAQERLLAQCAGQLADCAAALAGAFASGGRLFAFGNGGSACDAAHAVVEFMHPIIEKRPMLPAFTIGGDPAFLTAVGNDADFALAFAEQLRPLVRPGDVALGITTSGRAAGVLRGLVAARTAGALTLGFGGRDGGRLGEVCDFCFVVPSFNIHRIQEGHVLLLHLLWDLVHVAAGREDVL